MKKTNKILLYLLPFVVLFSIFIIGTFFDLEISKTLADLEFGQYYSSNGFAVFFEIFGETPVYFLASLSFSVLSVYFFNKKNKIKYFMYAFLYYLSFIACFVAFYKIFGYLIKIYDLVFSFKFLLFQLCISFAITFYINLLITKLKKSTINKLQKFAIICLVSILITNVIAQGLKPIFSRLRYRAMMYLNQTDFSGYTPWYIIKNNVLTDYHKAFNLTSDIFKSFPSGHTSAATSVLSVISLIYLFKNIKHCNKILIIVLSVLYVLIVGIARIIMGAHFLTDVVFAMIIGYSSFLFSNHLVLRKQH